MAEGPVHSPYHNTYQQDMLDAHLGLPVLLQGVNTYLTVLGNIRVKDLCEEEALWRFIWKVLPKHKLHFKDATSIRRSH